MVPPKTTCAECLEWQCPDYTLVSEGRDESKRLPTAWTLGSGDNLLQKQAVAYPTMQDKCNENFGSDILSLLTREKLFPQLSSIEQRTNQKLAYRLTVYRLIRTPTSPIESNSKGFGGRK